MKVIVAKRSREAQDVLHLFLKATETELPTFTPGAHICLRSDERHPWRRYSLISDPTDSRHYEIAVLRVEGGLSARLHDDGRVGQILEISEPINDFQLRDADHSLLIAGGIGVTPILSFSRALSLRHSSFELHVVARSPERLAFVRQLTALAGSRVNFYAGGAGGRRLHLPDIVPNFMHGNRIFVCGPRRMIESTREIAAVRGWPSTSLHIESFFTAASSDAAVDIELALSGLHVTVPKWQSVLDVAEANGAWSAASCRRGECGMCAVEFHGATVHHRDVCLDEQSRQTLMCPCVSRPLEPGLVLQL